MRRLQKWWIAFGVTALAVAIAYFWIDRPLSFFANQQVPPYRYVFIRMQQLPEPFAVIACAMLAFVGIRSFSSRPLARYERVAAAWGVAVIVTAALKNQLKILFGRTWPETWVNNNPSLIRDGAFGFNPLHGGAGYEAFPSGHTAAVCAAAAVLLVCYPKFRAVYALAVAVVVVGLIGANYHFFSDIIAGGFLGASVGLAAVTLAGLNPPARS